MTSLKRSHRTASRAAVRDRRFFRSSRGMRPSVRRVKSLTAAEREVMWHHFEAAYDGARREDFEKDLAEKQHVIVLKSADGALLGFSTLMVLERGVEGRRAVAVFSGDTIVNRDFWGQTALQRAFVWYLIAQRVKRPGVPVYWFLITKGYRTYLLMTRYFPARFPRHEGPTPAFEAAVLSELCRVKFGDAYDAASGLLRFGPESCRLKEDLADVPPRMLRDPDVRFFLEKNPRWADGEELCCLAAADDDFVAKATRVFL